MDQFGRLALDEFQDQKYRDDSDASRITYPVFSITVPDPPHTRVSYEQVYGDEVQRFLRETNNDLSYTLPSLRLLAIPSFVTADWETVLDIQRECFIRAINSIDLSPAALWLIKHQYDGFHPLPRAGNVETLFFGTSLYALVWTFNRTTQSTRGIFIQRYKTRNWGVDSGFDPLRDLLEQHKDYVYSPKLLAYCASLNISFFFDVVLGKKELSYVRHVERSTGYGPGSPGLRERYDIDELTSGLQGLGGSLNNMANNRRHLRMVESLLAFLERDPVCMDDISPETRDQVQDTTTRLLEGIPMAKSRIHATLEYIEYLKERSERLSTTLFALLTHEDAATGVKLAASSTRIAEDTKRDSSSMKTVAVMTMAFLPGTFVAALLALPSFDWGPAAGQFWVYWAVTIPSTILVFLIWGLLTNGRWVKERLAGSSTGKVEE